VTLSLFFGSFTKGCQTKHSDVDIAIFLESFCGKTEEEIFIILDKMTIKYRGLSFEPHVFLHRLIHGQHPFIREIFETGIQIFPEPKAQEARPQAEAAER
jgi:predicted nucleotidyltransferase